MSFHPFNKSIQYFNTNFFQVPWKQYNERVYFTEDFVMNCTYLVKDVRIGFKSSIAEPSFCKDDGTAKIKIISWSSSLVLCTDQFSPPTVILNLPWTSTSANDVGSLGNCLFLTFQIFWVLQALEGSISWESFGTSQIASKLIAAGFSDLVRAFALILFNAWNTFAFSLHGCVLKFS